MPETLLTTKLFIPPMPPRTVRRNELLDLLESGLSLEKRLVLVCAPAGYGKTTLICDWLRDMPNICWYSLEESDNEVGLFLSYLIAALQKAFPEIGEQAQGLLQAPQPPAPQVVLSSLLNDLSQCSAQIVLVLDDYQVIHTPSIHEGIAFLLDHLPTNVHIVITSRSDPALPLHRYRSRGQMIEIRAEHLRFSTQEVSGFMRDIAGIPLAQAEIAILENRTEGWIAGLQMAALSLRGRVDATTFIRSLAGTNRYIVDYLVEEALKNQPETVQRFLTETAILNRLCAPLCAAVLESEENSSREILVDLEHANLFLIPLDEERVWYRYHHLFRDLLVMQLKQTGESHVRELHRRAADWYENNGLVNEAIQHFIHAESFERAADLVERHTLSLFAQGELHQLVGWIRKLPAEVAARRPWLCIYQAWALAFAGNNSGAEALIETAIQAQGAERSDPDAREKLWAEINALRGFLAVTSGNLQKALELADLPDPESPSTRSSMRWALGYAWRMQGRLGEAARAFREMLALGQQMNNIWTISTASADLGTVLRLLGRLRDAESSYRTGLEAMRQAGASGLGFAGRLESFLANILYEQNRVEEAQQLVTASIAHNALWENPNHVAHGHWTQARIFFGLGDFAAAEVALRQAETVATQPSVVPPLRGAIEGLRVRLWLARGQLSEAVQWMEARPLGKAEKNNELFELQTLTHARIFLAQENLPAAYQLLESIEVNIRAGGRNNALIETLTLKALTAPNRSAALTTLDAALKLGIPAGYRRMFIDEGEALKSLLESLRGRSNLVEPLLGTAVEKNHLLTAREMDILRGLAEGLSNKEIGARLYISAGTVKAHSASIYRKLDAANRTEAIAKAKDLELL